MKLSRREIILISILLVLLIGYGYGHYIYSPNKSKMRALKEEVDLAQKVVQEYQLKAIPENKLYEDYAQAVQHTISITNRYYPDMLQSEIISDMQKIIEGSGIQVSSMNFSSPTYTVVMPRPEVNGTVSVLENLALSFNHPTEEVKETTQINSDQNEQVKYMSITLSFTGTYSNIKNFIHQINNNRYQLILNHIAFNSTNQKEMYVGNAVIDVYSMPHIAEEENNTSTGPVS